ncbi:MAG: hypothetical protein HQM15_05460 [Deltaproteobacteria bacterium]|nr:hypothetical protein [Deltaproteobacteria bacterium]
MQKGIRLSEGSTIAGNSHSPALEAQQIQLPTNVRTSSEQAPPQHPQHPTFISHLADDFNYLLHAGEAAVLPYANPLFDSAHHFVDGHIQNRTLRQGANEFLSAVQHQVLTADFVIETGLAFTTCTFGGTVAGLFGVNNLLLRGLVVHLASSRLHEGFESLYYGENRMHLVEINRDVRGTLNMGSAEYVGHFAQPVLAAFIPGSSLLSRGLSYLLARSLGGLTMSVGAAAEILGARVLDGLLGIRYFVEPQNDNIAAHFTMQALTTAWFSDCGMHVGGQLGALLHTRLQSGSAIRNDNTPSPVYESRNLPVHPFTRLRDLFTFPSIPTPALGLAGVALTLSHFLNPEAAHAMAHTASAGHTSPFVAVLSLVAGLSYLLLRKSKDGTVRERPKGQYWNQQGQSTHVEEALQMLEAGNLEGAREHLRTNNVHLVTVLGAGRHGVGLDKMSAQVTQHSQRLFGKSVVHVLLTHESDQDRKAADEINYQGTTPFISGAQINTDDRCALHASDPRYNDGLLQLADTVITSLPSPALRFALSEGRIKNFKPNAQIIVGMKSVLNSGRGIPASVYLALAQAGRFDLMWNLAFQTGLGFPDEMVGHESPTGPVKFSFDSVSEMATLRAMQVFAGDEANQSEDGHFVTAENKVFQRGDQVFLAAYLAYMKNVLAPDDGYRFCDWVIQNRKNLKPYELEEELCRYRHENEKALVSIFSQHEAAKINAERAAIEQAMIDAESNENVSCVGLENVDKLKEYFARRESTDEAEIKRAFRKNETGLEDLKGCTRLRHEDTFLNILNQLLDSEGLEFEEAFASARARLKKEASSTNFFAGIERRLNEELVAQGKVLPGDLAERDAHNQKTIEGLFAIDSLALRWFLDEEHQPGFVTRTKTWNKAPYQLVRAKIHESGLRWQSMLVIRDYIRRLQDARVEAHKDFTDDNNYQKSIQGMRDNLLALIDYLRKQRSGLAANPTAIRRVEQVVADIEKTQRILSAILGDWDQSPSRIGILFSNASLAISSFIGKRRDRPQYRLRGSMSHRLESLFLQLEKQFRLEENNLAHWASQASNIAWLNRELEALGLLDRITRSSRRA